MTTSALPGWRERNDTWMFPRSVLDDMARAAGATLTVCPIHDSEGQFRCQFTYMLKTDRGDDLGPQKLRDLTLERCIIFGKPKVA